MFASSFENFQNITSDVSSIVEFNSKIFYSSQDKLYRIDDDSIKKIYDIRGDEYAINRLVVIADNLYVCADNGLYLYDRDDASLKRIWHKFIMDEIISLNDLVMYDGKYFLATSKGMYESKDLQNVHKNNDLRNQLNIKRLIVDFGGNLNILASTSIFKFSSGLMKKMYDIGLDTDKQLNDIFVSDNIIYIASLKGQYKLEAGILKPLDVKTLGFPVNSLKLHNGLLYIGSNNGLFEYSFEQNNLYRINGGLGLKKINDIFVFENNIMLASTSGIFIEGDTNIVGQSDNKKISFGPSINELHKAVMTYNEISPNKIRNWRRRLKARALMPDLAVSYDKTMYGTAGTGSYDGKVYVGPNDWGVSMSWDLGNLVFDDDETTIDNRSRLNTQQRVDMLEEISRIYFERKRTVFKYNNDKDNYAERFERQLLIEELTASLDGYTGGWFSQNL